MLNFKKTLILSMLVTLPMQVTATSNPAMAPIISYLLSDVSIPQEINLAPIADAGEDKRILKNTSIVLSATNSSDDDEVVSYQWKHNGTLLSNEESFSKVFIEGTHSLTLKVFDKDGLSSVDYVNIHAVSQAMLDDEVGSKSIKHLGYRTSFLETLNTRQNLQRTQAPQNYLDQQNATSSPEFSKESLLPLSPQEVASISVTVSNPTPKPLEEGEVFTFNDFYLETRNSKLYLVNKTSRAFNHFIVEKTDANNNVILKKIILDSVIEPFMEYELSTFTDSEQMTITNVYPLFDIEMSYALNAVYNNPDEWRVTTLNERKTFNYKLAQLKYSNNSIHAVKLFEDLATTQTYMDEDYSWSWIERFTSELTDYNNPKEYAIKEMYNVLTPQVVPFNLQTYIKAEGTTFGNASLGIVRGTRMLSLSPLTLYMEDGIPYSLTISGYNLMIHELMHAFKYTHESAMTYGYSDVLSWVNSFLYRKDRTVEELPKYIFDTKELATNKYRVRVYSTDSSSEEYFNVNLFSDSKISATITPTSRKNEFIIETDSSFSHEHILRVFSFDSTQVMSKIINLTQ